MRPYPKGFIMKFIHDIVAVYIIMIRLIVSYPLIAGIIVGALVMYDQYLNKKTTR